MSIAAFLQARMSSSRFPGKVLAPFRGEPIIRHVIRAVERVEDIDVIVVATSIEPSDEPLAAYLESTGVNIFRGSLDDVLDRFQRCAEQFPCDWIVRICCDSPLLNAEIVTKAVSQAKDTTCDLVTTTLPRTFPKGQNVEVIRKDTLLGLNSVQLADEEREHLTSHFYNHRDNFQIVNVESGDPSLADQSVAVDTVEDLRRLEQHARLPYSTA